MFSINKSAPAGLRPGRGLLTASVLAGVVLVAASCGSDSGDSASSASATGSASASAAADTKDGTTVVAFAGTNGIAADAGPQCVGEDPSISGAYGEAWCFGTTFAGGSGGLGTVYRVKPDGSQMSVLVNFDAVNGLGPSIGVAIAPDRSYLYGSTTQGGKTGSGEIWAYNTATEEVTSLHSFVGPQGTTPQMAPIILNGTLYGLAGQGGANGVGAIYAQPVAGGDVTILHQFAGGTGDVANPYGALTFNPNDGLLYGLGFGGGAEGMGGIFSVQPDGSGYQLRASLNSQTGGVPQMSALQLSPNGSLYGVGWVGGNGAGTDGSSGDGTIFKFDPATNEVTQAFAFTQETGTQPYGNIAMSEDGQWLYAATWKGGANGLGTIVAVAADGSSSEVIVDFEADRTGGLTIAGIGLSADGQNLLTVTAVGGANSAGALVSAVVPESAQ